MSINCQDTSGTRINCQDPSGCTTLNCPPHCTAQGCVLSHDGPCDSPTEQTDSMTYSASLQNPCPDLDPSSSMDSLQTHDSLVTPESPYLPSPIESLEEGTTEGVTQVQALDPVTPDATHVTGLTQVTEVTQVRTDDSLAYDSLVTALSWLSLEPNPDPLSDLHHDFHPLRPDLDPIGSSDRTMTHLDGTYTQV